jgi:hypothetical protein
VVLFATLLLAAGCGTPQVAGDPDCFKEVDALYTAVTSKNAKLLGESEARLRKLHAAGKLSDAGLRALEPIIARARGGDWRPAAEELYVFMRAQRGPQRKG